MLSVRIKKRISDVFTLDVEFDAGNETLALLGASGCGKSLTLQCIAGLLRPDSGRIVLNDRVLFDSECGINLPPQKRRVGYLFQHYSIFPNMTVLQNIALGVRNATKLERQSLAMRHINTMRLDGFESRRPHELSGGQLQRVALARALATQPEVLLLDEPFSALDDYLKWQLELELSDTMSEFGGTSIFVSHSRDEVYRLCESVCVLENGKNERQNTVAGLFRKPETLAAALISGCKNYSRVKIQANGRVYAIDWGVEFTVEGEIPEGLQYVGVRALYFRPASPSDENAITCRVARTVDDVFSAVLMLEAPAFGTESGSEYSQLRVELPKAEWAALGAPSVLTICAEPQDIMLLK